MKSRLTTFSIPLLLVVALCACSKNEPVSPSAVETSTPAKSEVPKAVEAVKAIEPPKVAETPPAVEAPKTPEVAKPVEDTSIQDLIAKARSLAAEKKYVEASAVVQQLGSKTLNADQATLVDGLKQQIQKAMAAQATGNAGSALGNVLPK